MRCLLRSAPTFTPFPVGVVPGSSQGSLFRFTPFLVGVVPVPKSVPKRFARGIFNSGFLATESGTLARSVGDVLISVAASAGVANMLSSLFLGMLALVVASFVLMLKYYEDMIEREDEDDKSVGSLTANNSN